MQLRHMPANYRTFVKTLDLMKPVPTRRGAYRGISALLMPDLIQCGREESLHLDRRPAHGRIGTGMTGIQHECAAGLEHFRDRLCISGRGILVDAVSASDIDDEIIGWSQARQLFELRDIMAEQATSFGGKPL